MPVPPLGDMRTGYVLGALYNATDTPFQDNPEVFGVEFDDGARCTYDQESHTFRFSMPGGSQLFEMTPEGARLVSKLDIYGEVTISKSLTVTETVQAKAVNDETGSMATLRSRTTNMATPITGLASLMCPCREAACIAF